jgi:deoxyadenosine/deoxycytidine kinase
MADYVILISGNIAAGKTSTIDFLTKNSRLFAPFLSEGGSLVTIPEFIDHEALEIYYHDMRSYTAMFEDSCLTGRIVRHAKAKEGKGIYIFDRGIIEGTEIFCQNSFELGNLRHTDYANYSERVRRRLDDLDRSAQERWLEQLVIYLKVDDTNILLERHHRRGTPGERIRPEYIQSINDRYKKFFQPDNLAMTYQRYGLRPPKVITVDASVDCETDDCYHNKILEQIITELEVWKDGRRQRMQ